MITFKFFFYVEFWVRVCVFAGVAVGTGVGASRRVLVLGVWRVWARAGVWACGSKFSICEFSVFSFWFLVFSFSVLSFKVSAVS